MRLPRSVALIVLAAAVAAVPAAALQPVAMRYGIRVAVRDAITGAPVPRATVTFGPDRTMAIADAQGRLSIFAGVGQPADLTANAEGYFEGRYGQMWPLDTDEPRVITKDDVQRGLVVYLWRSATLEGIVSDGDQRPMDGVTVRLFERPLVAAQRSGRVVTARTDSRGRYAFGGLAPGTYVAGVIQTFVARKRSTAEARNRPDDSEWSLEPAVAGARRAASRAGRPHTYSTTFYPMAADMAAAEPIRLEPGRDRRNIHIVLEPVPGDATVAGIVSGAAPDARLSGHVRLTRIGNTNQDVPVSLHHAVAALDPERRFVFPGIPAGVYELRAEFRAARAPRAAEALFDAPAVLSKTLRLTVGGEDLENLSIDVDRGPGLIGQVHFLESDQKPSPGELADGAAILQPVGIMDRLPPIPLDASAMFHAPPLQPGLYRFWFDPPRGWRVRSVALDGHEAAGDPLLEANDNDGHTALVTLTTQGASLRLAIDADRPDAEVGVFIFPADRVSGLFTADRMLRVRMSAAARFTSPPLRPGDYHVVAVSRPLFETDWRDPQVLRRLERVATRVTLSDGERLDVTLPLRVVP